MRYSRGMLSVVSSSTITYTNLRPTRGRAHATRVYQGGAGRVLFQRTYASQTICSQSATSMCENICRMYIYITLMLSYGFAIPLPRPNHLCLSTDTQHALSDLTTTEHEYRPSE